MKYGLLALSALCASLLFSASASADEPTIDNVKTLPMITIYGKRPPLPSVVVEITRPTAAHEAGRAHDEMRNAWLLKTEPAAMKGQ